MVALCPDLLNRLVSAEAQEGRGESGGVKLQDALEREPLF